MNNLIANVLEYIRASGGRRSGALACMLFGLMPAMFAQDLSRYRTFQIGMELPAVALMGHLAPTAANVIHERPALLQELEWRPDRSVPSSTGETVRAIAFTFYNGRLFQIFVDYDPTKTEGLTPDDLIESISAVYGKAARPTATIDASSRAFYAYSNSEKVLAQWQDLEYSWTLVHASYASTYGLIGRSKRVGALAQAAMVEGARLDALDAPQRERDRLDREAENEKMKAQKARSVNQPNFRP